MTLSAACESFQRDIEARKLSYSSRRGYAFVLGKLCAFCAERGATDLGQVDTALLRSWRET